MMHVTSTHADLETRRKQRQRRQCRRGIGTAREGNEHMRSRRQHVGLAQGLLNVLQEPRDRALHRAGHFGMVHAVTQMSSRALRISWFAIVLITTRISARADEEPEPTPPGLNPTIVRALADVRTKYGADAVMMEGFLLSLSIQNGAVLETAITIGEIEEHDTRKYLPFIVETGIIYNDRELSADSRLGRTWTRIIERSLRMFRSLDLPADGLRFAISYGHKPYVDESDLRTHLREGHGDSESIVVYLLTADVHELLATKIDGQQLADRAVVLVDGKRQRIRVEPAEIATPDGSRPTP